MKRLESDKQLSNKFSFKHKAISLFAIAVVSMLVVSANANTGVTLAFTTNWTSESVYKILITVQNPNTYAYTNYILTTTNMSSGVTIPSGYTLTSICEYSNQSATRFTSSFKPETDSFVQFNITSPSGSTITSNSLVTPYPFDSSDNQLGAGYNEGAAYYYTVGQWNGVLTLTTGTWTITITTYTQ